jgi:hypothetical protein
LKDKIYLNLNYWKNESTFISEEKQPNITSGIRYFLRDVDRPQNRQIIIENGIIASTETP